MVQFKPGAKCGASFVSYRIQVIVPEAHVEEVLVDTLHEAVIVTAGLHSLQNAVHPVETKAKLLTASLLDTSISSVTTD